MANPKDDSIKIDGMKHASELLSGVDEATRSRILREIAAQDPALAEKLKKQMVTFDAVLKLPSAELAKVIGAVSIEFLALALRGLDPESEVLFYSLISSRRGDEIKATIDTMGPRKFGEVKAAREKLIEIAQSLFDSGEIKTKLTRG